MLKVQARVIELMETLRLRGGDRRLALVSHADVIKAALCFHLSVPLDGMSRFEIAPASVSTLVVSDWGARVLGINDVTS